MYEAFSLSKLYPEAIWNDFWQVLIDLAWLFVDSLMISDRLLIDFRLIFDRSKCLTLLDTSPAKCLTILGTLPSKWLTVWDTSLQNV